MPAIHILNVTRQLAMRPHAAINVVTCYYYCCFKNKIACRKLQGQTVSTVKGKGSPYSTAERRVPELIPVLGSQPAADVSHKPGGRLPLLFARPAVTPTTLKRAATNFAAW